MYPIQNISQAVFDSNGLPFNAVKAAVTSYDANNNPLIVLYYDKDNTVIRTAALTYDVSGRFVDITWS